MKPGTSRREQTQREQESRIVAAATAEFRQSGVRHASIERIAENAGVSRSTLYRRFPDKDELLTAVIADLRRQLAAEVAAKLAGLDPRAIVVEGFCHAMAYLKGDQLPRLILGDSPEAVDLLVGIAAPRADDIINEFSRAAAAALRAAGASMPEEQLQCAAEVQVRMFVSLMTVPSHALDISDAEQVRQFAEKLLAPMVW